MRERLRRLASPGLAAPGVLALGLLVQAVVLVRLARGMWFFGDDWDFLLVRSIGSDPVHALLKPHNEHWSTLPVIAFRLMFTLFGLKHHLPYALLPIAAHLAAFAVLYLVLRRATVSPWVASVSTLVVALVAGGAGAMNPLWDFQIGFIGSCLFGVVAMLLLDRRRWLDIAAVVSLVLSLMCSGIGLLMVAWVTLDALFRSGLRRAVLVAAAPVACYLAWYLSFGHNPGVAPKAEVAPFGAVYGIANLWSLATDVQGAGPAILAVLVAAVLLPRHGTRLYALAASGLLTVVLAYALFGYSRSGFAQLQPALGRYTYMEPSRYVYVGVFLTGPAVVCVAVVLASRLRGQPWVRLAGTVVLVGAVLALSIAQDARFQDERNSVTPRLRPEIGAAVALIRSGAPLLGSQVEPAYNPQVTVAALSRSSVLAALPPSHPQPVDRLQVASTLQVAVGSSPPIGATAGGARLTGRGSKPRPVPNGSCLTAAPVDGRIALPVGPHGAMVRIVVAGTRQRRVGTMLAHGGVHSLRRNWSVSVGSPFYVASTASGSELRILLPTGRVTVCAGTGA